jgi:ribosomal protein S18 acetylase RimI-like enzyme
MSMKIVRAERKHLDQVAPLFDQYRQFYKQPPDAAAARAYIQERLNNGDAAIFLAEESGKTLGFVQLYPSLASISMKPIWILYDLFVSPDARTSGVGRALMDRARQHGEETKACQIILETATDNAEAQRLYEKLGYKRDEEFFRYALALN